MNTTKIVCPKCNAVAKLSLIDTSYIGPRRCWKCHEYFSVTIENNRVTSCQPLSQEEYERQYAAKTAREKGQLSLLFPGHEETDTPKVTPEKPPDDTTPGKPKLFPPDRLQTFIPLEDTDEKPEKPKKAKQRDSTEPNTFPPERFRTFVPLEDTDEKPGEK